MMKIKSFFLLHKHLVLLSFFCLLYFIFFSFLTITRHNSLYSMRYDLGNMDQTVWNTSKGYIFTLTEPAGLKNISRFAYHADFFLIFLAPLYWIYSSPIILLIIQSLVLSLGAIPLYFLSLKVLKNKNISLILSLSYLLYPALEKSNIYEFHAVILATTFLLAAFYFGYLKKYKLFFLFAFLAISTKEQIPLLISGMGIYFLLSKKNLKVSLITIVLPLIWFYLCVWQIIPYFRSGDTHFALGFYEDLGASPTKIFYGFLTKPLVVWKTILMPNRLIYLWKLFSPLGFLPLLSPFIILSFPDLFINLLSKNSPMQSIDYQYTANITPFLFISLIFSIKFILSKFPKITKAILIYLLIWMLYSVFYLGPLPFSKSKYWDPVSSPNKKAQIVLQTAKLIDAKYTVTVTNNIAPHFTDRNKVYSFPINYDKSDYTVVLAEGNYENINQKQIQVYLDKLSKNPQYKLILKDDNFSVFKRLASS